MPRGLTWRAARDRRLAGRHDPPDGFLPDGFLPGFLPVRTYLQISPLTDSERAERVTVPEVFSVRKLNVPPQKIDWTERNEWKHLAGIPIPDTNGRPVELLLGANVLKLCSKRSLVSALPDSRQR